MLAKQAIDRFMSAMLGNMPNYEEAIRALYQGDRDIFLKMIQSYPKDVREYLTLKLKIFSKLNKNYAYAGFRTYFQSIKDELIPQFSPTSSTVSAVISVSVPSTEVVIMTTPVSRHRTNCSAVACFRDRNYTLLNQ